MGKILRVAKMLAPSEADLVQQMNEEEFGPQWRWPDHYLTDAYGLLAIHSSGRPAGFTIYNPGKQRIILERIVVEPWARRQGAGRMLVETLIEKLKTGRRQVIVTYVPETHLEAQQFFSAMGFLAKLPIIPSFFPDRTAAYAMVWERRRD